MNTAPGMHEIEPYYGWLKYYQSEKDSHSPFHGKEYNYDLYSTAIYNYFIDPGWDFMGSETLYVKVLYADYHEGFLVIEFLGEWNDAINNDAMHLKRNLVDHFTKKYGINKYILIGENVLNFHGSDDCYYEEWFEDVEEGWIAAINFRDFVMAEMKTYNLDAYINMGGSLEIENWRTLKPQVFCALVNKLVTYRIG
jgi:hypothetical protein